MANRTLVKEGDWVRIKPQYSKYYSIRLMGRLGVVEQCVKLENPTYTRYFYVVRFRGIDKLYRISSGVLQVIKKPMDMNPNKNSAPSNDTPSQVSERLLSNVEQALNEAAARIKERAELRAKAEQESQKNSVTIHVPYTRAFRVVENADAVRAKLRTVYSLLLADQKVTPEQIVAILENFDECQKMIYEIASYAVKNAKRTNL